MAADVYCNLTTDLQREVPDIDTFDQKREVASFVLDSGTVYTARNVGYVESLFRSGLDLGDPESSAASVTTDGQWHYDADADVLTLCSTLDPNTYYSVKAGRSWATVKAEAIAQASEELRFELNRQVFRLPVDEQNSTGRIWPSAIIRATAKLACLMLVSPYNQQEAERLRSELYSKDENQPGLLVRLKSGDLALPDAPTSRMASGELRVVSVDDATTGAIVGSKGSATIDHDLIEIKITTAGTLVRGTASPVRYSARVKSSEGLQTQYSVEGGVVTGSYDPIGWGVSVMFAEGDYTLNDTWVFEVNGLPATAGETKRTTLVQARRV